MINMIIGVTGYFGSGKTTVSKLFKEKGARVIDADKVYHSLIKPRKALYLRIKKIFGREVLNRNGAIDRKKLGKIVFDDKTMLLKLNSITHPEIIKKIRKMSKSAGITIVEAPLLIESGLYKEMDKVVIVAASMEKQVKRLKKSRGIEKEGMLKRISMQMGHKKKLAFADFVIDNNGAVKNTKDQVEKIWERIGEDYVDKSKF
ncbi:MAG: dephospho-CoA kinase [Candidatus Omnitrophota bacterium]